MSVTDSRQHPYASPFYDPRSRSPASPNFPAFPVQFPSPSATSPAFIASPRLPPPPVPVRSSSPVPQQGSQASLSTTASTSSRTLKTPQSKFDQQYPGVKIRGESGSLERPMSTSPSPAMRNRIINEEPRSPTPNRKELRPSTERLARESPPALAMSPLPPTPGEQPEKKSSSRPGTAGSSKSKPAPLDILREQRLSQDWVCLNLPADGDLCHAQLNASSLIAESPPRPSKQPSRLPPPTIVPMKLHSPQRPSFDRTQSDPLATPNTHSQSQPYNRPRSSMDPLRSASPISLQGKSHSYSTPPAAVIEAASTTAPSPGGLRSLFRNGDSRQGSTPPLRGRRSEDILRPSMDRKSSMDALQEKEPTKKELKAMQKEAQRSLGVGTPINTPEDTRKLSGLSLKKSSGALKAFFNRSGSGKGKAKEVPPLPSGEERSRAMGRLSTSDGLPRPSTLEGLPRPSISSIRRPRTPASPSPIPTARAASAQSRHSRGSGGSIGQNSPPAERTQYPAPPMNRAVSQPMEVPSNAARTRLPSRDLPPLPPPSPSPQPAQIRGDAPLFQPTLVDILSLPYLGPRASVVIEHMSQMTTGEAEVRSDAVSPASSGSTTRPNQSPLEETGTETPSPIKPSKSLHLLSLPDLDLDFDVSFDTLGLSPSTPRRSPGRSGNSSPRKSPSRATTTRKHASPNISPSLGRSRTERRSKSFDGLGANGGEELWRSVGMGEGLHPSVAKFFASSSSPSAPILSKQLSDPIPPVFIAQDRVTPSPLGPGEVQPTDAGPSQHRVNRSFSSQPSAPSSSDHARTPSNASSTNETNETESPSPPRTPEDQTVRLGFPVLPGKSTPARTGSVDDTEVPFSLGTPPSIPLPPVPTDVPAYIPTAAAHGFVTASRAQTAVASLVPVPTKDGLSLAPAAVIAAAAPEVAPIIVEEKKDIKKPPSRPRQLQSRSKLVILDTTKSTKTLCREVERFLYTCVAVLVLFVRLNQVLIFQVQVSLSIIYLGRSSRVDPERPPASVCGDREETIRTP